MYNALIWRTNELLLNKGMKFASIFWYIFWMTEFYLIGVPVSEFSQSDLAANSVMYYHTSPTEEYMDAFTYTVTDGTNEVVYL